MPIQVRCAGCGDFFTPDADELKTFIAEQADLKYLNRIPCPPGYQEQYKSPEAFRAMLLFGYCPYCREVKFGRPISGRLPNEQLSVDKYIKAFLASVRDNGGFQEVDSRDYVALVDTDEDQT